MTHEDIIRIAENCDLNRVCGPISALQDDELEYILQFGELIAARERERCAKLCDGWTHANGDDCAAAIRARSELPTSAK